MRVDLLEARGPASFDSPASMGGNPIKDVSDPVDPQDVATLASAVALAAQALADALAADAAHAVALDPHPQYATDVEIASISAALAGLALDVTSLAAGHAGLAVDVASLASAQAGLDVRVDAAESAIVLHEARLDAAESAIALISPRGATTFTRTALGAGITSYPLGRDANAYAPLVASHLRRLVVLGSSTLATGSITVTIYKNSEAAGNIVFQATASFGASGAFKIVDTTVNNVGTDAIGAADTFFAKVETGELTSIEDLAVFIDHTVD